MYMKSYAVNDVAFSLCTYLKKILHLEKSIVIISISVEKTYLLFSCPNPIFDKEFVLHSPILRLNKVIGN